jgi:hypothetical protein
MSGLFVRDIPVVCDCALRLPSAEQDEKTADVPKYCGTERLEEGVTTAARSERNVVGGQRDARARSPLAAGAAAGAAKGASGSRRVTFGDGEASQSISKRGANSWPVHVRDGIHDAVAYMARPCNPFSP